MDSENGETDIETQSLVGARTMVLRRSGDSDTITLLEHDGRATLTVTVTPEAMTLTLGSVDVELNVERNLAINAQSIALHGREGVTIKTEGELSTVGRAQLIASTHGDVRVEANDDVKLNAERILLNC